LIFYHKAIYFGKKKAGADDSGIGSPPGCHEVVSGGRERLVRVSAAVRLDERQ